MEEVHAVPSLLAGKAGGDESTILVSAQLVTRYVRLHTSSTRSGPGSLAAWRGRSGRSSRPDVLQLTFQISLLLVQCTSHFWGS